LGFEAANLTETDIRQLELDGYRLNCLLLFEKAEVQKNVSYSNLFSESDWKKN